VTEDLKYLGGSTDHVADLLLCTCLLTMSSNECLMILTVPHGFTVFIHAVIQLEPIGLDSSTA